MRVFLAVFNLLAELVSVAVRHVHVTDNKVRHLARFYHLHGFVSA